MLRAAAEAAVTHRFAALLPGETDMRAPNEPVTVAEREAETITGQSL